MTLEERVAWVLVLVKGRDKSLNDVQLGKKLGINKNTIGKYVAGRGNMKGCALAGIVKHFNISGEWLISGRGEPFPGAHTQFPEICGPPGVSEDNQNKITSYIKANIIAPAGVNESGAGYGSPDSLFSSEQKINIEEAMGKTYKVLNAGTALSVALYMNIQQFAAALDTGQELRECKDLINAMQKQIDTLNDKVDRLTAHPGTTEGQGDGSVKKAM